MKRLASLSCENRNFEVNSSGNQHNKEIITIEIIDDKTYDPDPLPEQLAALNRIINNLEEVLQNSLDSIQVVNDDYVERCGISDWIPDPLTKENLVKLICFGHIIILREHKNGYSYFQLECGYADDDEHGLSVVFHNDILIEYAAIGEMDYIKVYNDLGPHKEVFRNANIERREFGKDMVHSKLPKYNKHKPWQIEATIEYLKDEVV